MLHLQHGLSAKVIAEALDRPAGTVRTQVMRALELLRKALPASLGTAAMAAASGGRGLAAVRSIVLERAGGAAMPITAAGTGMAWLGVATMQKALVSVGALSLLAVAATATWIAIRSADMAPDRVEGVAAVAAREETRASEANLPAPRAERVPAMPANDRITPLVTEPEEPPTITVAGLVVDVDGLRLSAPAFVELTLVDDRAPDDLVVLLGNGDHAPSDHSFVHDDDAGCWRTQPLEPGTYRVFAVAADMVPVRRDVTLVEGQIRRFELPVVRGPQCAFELTFGAAAAHDGLVNGTLELRDATGAVVLEQRLFGYFDDLKARLLRRTLCLAPGSYTLTVAGHDAQHRQAQRAFAVPATGPIRLRVE